MWRASNEFLKGYKNISIIVTIITIYNWSKTSLNRQTSSDRVGGTFECSSDIN